MSVKKPIILNGFTMNTVNHVSYGLWRHPQDETYRHTEIAYWVELAKTLEAGGFDALFIADALGHLDVYGGNSDASLQRGIQSPVNDPLLLVSAMAAATKNLGFGVTVSTTYEQPYLLARKFTTLDHLTKGRVAWNIVTSQLDSAARNLGLDVQISHDERYEIAEEFLEVAYKLWQWSWADDAVVRDPGSENNPDGLYTDPSKVRSIAHHGRYFKVPGPHLSEPSPQRVPVLFQAGGSPRGQRFAARHAEVVFVAGADEAGIRRNVAAIKALARDEGRSPDAIKFISAVSVITAETDALAEAKQQDYGRYYDVHGAVVHYSATTGVDFAQQDIDTPIRYRETDSNRSVLRMFDDPNSGRSWTLREALVSKSGIGRSKSFVGGPESVADGIESWLEATDTDGINLIHVISPGSFVDFATHVVPELRRRERLRETPANSLRGKLFGSGARPPVDHPSARFKPSSFASIKALTA